MGKSHVLAIIQALRRAMADRGFVVAVTNAQKGWTTTARVYRSERDKGHPERALAVTSSFNKWTVCDVVDHLDNRPDCSHPRFGHV